MQKIANFMTTLAIAASVFGTAGGRVQAAIAPPTRPTPLTIIETTHSAPKQPDATQQCATGTVLTGTASISGKVTLADTGALVTSGFAYAYRRSGSLYQYENLTLISNQNVYTLTQLPAGDYKVQFIPFSIGTEADYSFEYYNNKSNQTSADVLTLANGQAITGIDFALDKGTHLTGKITEADTGLPIWAFVTAFGYATSDSVASTRSDPNGFYTLTLASGDYKLTFDPPVGSAYLDQIYNGVSDFYSATKVVVNTSAPVPPINVALQRGVYITGRITNPNTGAGIESAHADVYGTDNKNVGYGYSDANGYYTATTPSGNVKILFNKSGYVDSYYNSKGDFASADVIKVTAPNTVANINGTLRGCAVFTQKVFLPLVVK